MRKRIKEICLRVMQAQQAIGYVSNSVDCDKISRRGSNGAKLIALKYVGGLMWLYEKTDWIFKLANKIGTGV